MNIASIAATGDSIPSAGLVDSSQQALGYPFHDRLPDRLLAREMSKQRALRELHVPGDGGGGDLAGVLPGGQRDYGLYCHGSTLLCGQVLGTIFHDHCIKDSN
jgi:hypothetical protein